jgi:hypothetical protein
VRLLAVTVTIVVLASLVPVIAVHLRPADAGWLLFDESAAHLALNNQTALVRNEWTPASVTVPVAVTSGIFLLGFGLASWSWMPPFLRHE